MSPTLNCMITMKYIIMTKNKIQRSIVQYSSIVSQLTDGACIRVIFTVCPVFRPLTKLSLDPTSFIWTPKCKYRVYPLRYQTTSVLVHFGPYVKSSAHFGPNEAHFSPCPLRSSPTSVLELFNCELTRWLTFSTSSFRSVLLCAFDSRTTVQVSINSPFRIIQPIMLFLLRGYVVGLYNTGFCLK